MEKAKENNKFDIQTVTASVGNQVSVCPRRGGIITSIKFPEKEILYLDESTLEDTKSSVRGGIPILFPNAGPLTCTKYPNLKQHGFARNSSRWTIDKLKNGFHETLVSDLETREFFPYDFQFSLFATFENDGSFLIRQEIKNLENDKDMPLSMGLHPYFKVPNDKKGEVKFNFEGGKFLEEQIEDWANGRLVSVDNPKIKNQNTKMEVIIPQLGALVIDASPEFKKIWVWSLPGKDFICFEPIMRDEGGLVDDPEMIRPKDIFRSSVVFSLKNE